MTKHIHIHVIGKAKDATNHLGEKEYYTYRRWKEAIKAAYPNARFEGNEEMCNAVPGGDWDGEKGCVYAKKTSDAEFNAQCKNILSEINRALTDASRNAERLRSQIPDDSADLMAKATLLEQRIDNARDLCFKLR